MDSRYKMFKNFMINELGITKEDIREWVEHSCKQEARAMVEGAYGSLGIDAILRREVNSLLRDAAHKSANELSKKIAGEVFSNVKITFDKKD